MALPEEKSEGARPQTQGSWRSRHVFGEGLIGTKNRGYKSIPMALAINMAQVHCPAP